MIYKYSEELSQIGHNPNLDNVSALQKELFLLQLNIAEYMFCGYHFFLNMNLNQF